MRIARKVRKDAKLYEYGGVAMTALEWSRELCITVRAFHMRLEKGWTGDMLFAPNMREHGKYRNYGKGHTNDLRN